MLSPFTVLMNVGCIRMAHHTAHDILCTVITLYILHTFVHLQVYDLFLMLLSLWQTLGSMQVNICPSQGRQTFTTHQPQKHNIFLFNT